MSIIDEISVSASGDSHLSDVLRKCLVLGFAVGNKELQTWANRELDGYGDADELPRYRAAAPTTLKVDAMNMAYRHTGSVLPVYSVPSEYRGLVGDYDLRQGVGELEDLVTSARQRGDGTLRINVDPMLGQLIDLDGGYKITDIWRELSVAQIAGVLDSIRNTALRLALELGQLADPQHDPSRIPDGTVAPVIQAVIYGGTNTVGGVIGTATQNQTVLAGDAHSLVAYLSALGMADTSLASLREAIDVDSTKGTDGPGARVWTWLKEAARTATRGGVNVATSVVTAAVLKYYGLG